MRKITTLIVTAFFALMLTACNKSDGKADFEAYKAWQKVQEELLNTAMIEAGNNATEEDSEQKLQQAMLKGIAQIQENAKQLKLSDEEVVRFKDKSMEMMGLAVKMLEANGKVQANPEDKEAQSNLASLNTQLQAVAAEAQALESKLIEKYGEKSEEKPAK